jgi:hypothetical protein
MEISKEMFDQSPPPGYPPNWTARHWLLFEAAFIERLSDLILEEIRKDIAQIDSLDAFAQGYLHAYWRTVGDRIHSSRRGKVESPASTVEDLESQVSLVEEVFGIEIGSPKPSNELKGDVANRLEWLKQCVGKDFERSVFGIVDRHNIVSPIEQIFLMEWCYAKVEDLYSLKLQPQEPIRTAAGEFFLDYLVTSTHDSTPKFAVAIELDGHEFHEKTKEQVLQDKRFSGAEVVRNCKNCIKEVISFIEQMRRTPEIPE